MEFLFASILFLLFQMGIFFPNPFVPAQVSTATPGWVQQCQTNTWSSGVSSSSVVIGSNGGTTDCTTNFTAGDALIVDYRNYKASGVSDLTTSNISATGATITWSKAGSGLDAAGTSYVGTFYACPGAISSPTNAITVKITWPYSSSTYVGFWATEVSSLSSGTCLDQYTTQVTASSEPSTLTSSTSATLARATEYADSMANSNSSTTALSAGTCWSGTGTMPYNMGSVSSHINFNIEHYVTSSTSGGSCSMGAANASVGYQIGLALFK